MAERLVENILTAQRTDRRRPRHRCGRTDRPEPRRLADGRPRPAQAPRRQDRGTAGVAPSFQGPTAIPGIGVRTGARILMDVGDGSSLPPAAHLAAYASLAPTTWSSGSSIRREQPSRHGNKQLKRAFSLSAFTAMADPASHTYCDKKITQGKRRTQALLCRQTPSRSPLCHAPRRNGTAEEGPQQGSAGCQPQHRCRILRRLTSDEA